MPNFAPHDPPRLAVGPQGHPLLLAACLSCTLAIASFTGATPPKPRPGPPSSPPATVRVGLVKKQKLQAKANIVGRLLQVRIAKVAAERAGRVVRVLVDAGDRVIAGDDDDDKTLLAQLDDAMEQIELRRAQGALQQAQALVENAQAIYALKARHSQYLKDLDAQGSANHKEVQDAADEEIAAKAAHDSARAVVVSAEAVLQRAKLQIRRSRIVAPFDGIVVEKLTEVGQWVDAGDTIVTIISTGPIDAIADVPEWLINEVRPTQAIDIKIEPIHMTVSGKVVSITPLASNAARTFPVKIRIADTQQGKLKAGMSVLVQIPTGQLTQMLTIPRDAVQRTPQGPIVWFNRNGKAMRMKINILFGHKDRYAVTPQSAQGQPLMPGMQVIVEGAERLMFPGQPLRIMNREKVAAQ